ncbi:MAG: two-component system, cell cycle response regulator DivK [Chloroflexota bacterium]|nr:two-component system, cell cycle response regulator DivK [Chloroflexota bacterium]
MANELILIVEDNEKNLKLARDVLRFHGYRTVEAADGETAITMSLQHLPALVLMDIQLPGIDGIAAMKRIRADERTRHIPTVALTASVMSGDRERFDEAGFDGFISKPIDIKEFPAQVRGYLHAGQ